MNCQSFDQVIQQVLDQRRSVAGCAVLARHARQCSRCRRSWEAYRAMEQAGVLTAAASPTERHWRGPARRLAAGIAMAAAMVACLLVAASALWLGAPSPPDAMVATAGAVPSNESGTPDHAAANLPDQVAHQAPESPTLIGEVALGEIEMWIEYWEALSRLPEQAPWRNYPRYASELVLVGPFTTSLGITIDLLGRNIWRQWPAMRMESQYQPHAVGLEA